MYCLLNVFFPDGQFQELLDLLGDLCHHHLEALVPLVSNPDTGNGLALEHPVRVDAQQQDRSLTKRIVKGIVLAIGLAVCQSALVALNRKPGATGVVEQVGTQQRAGARDGAVLHDQQRLELGHQAMQLSDQQLLSSRYPPMPLGMHVPMAAGAEPVSWCHMVDRRWRPVNAALDMHVKPTAPTATTVLDTVVRLAYSRLGAAGRLASVTATVADAVACLVSSKLGTAGRLALAAHFGSAVN